MQEMQGRRHLVTVTALRPVPKLAQMAGVQTGLGWQPFVRAHLPRPPPSTIRRPFSGPAPGRLPRSVLSRHSRGALPPPIGGLGTAEKRVFGAFAQHTRFDSDLTVD